MVNITDNLISISSVMVTLKFYTRIFWLFVLIYPHLLSKFKYFYRLLNPQTIWRFIAIQDKKVFYNKKEWQRAMNKIIY